MIFSAALGSGDVCGTTQYHSAAIVSLSTSLQLVTWILAGVIMPVETDAGIVRR